MPERELAQPLLGRERDQRPGRARDQRLPERERERDQRLLERERERPRREREQERKGTKILQGSNLAQTGTERCCIAPNHDHTLRKLLRWHGKP